MLCNRNLKNTTSIHINFYWIFYRIRKNIDRNIFVWLEMISPDPDSQTSAELGWDVTRGCRESPLSPTHRPAYWCTGVQYRAECTVHWLSLSSQSGGNLRSEERGSLGSLIVWDNTSSESVTMTVMDVMCPVWHQLNCSCSHRSNHIISREIRISAKHCINIFNFNGHDI